MSNQVLSFPTVEWWPVWRRDRVPPAGPLRLPLLGVCALLAQPVGRRRRRVPVAALGVPAGQGGQVGLGGKDVKMVIAHLQILYVFFVSFQQMDQRSRTGIYPNQNFNFVGFYNEKTMFQMFTRPCPIKRPEKVPGSLIEKIKNMSRSHYTAWEYCSTFLSFVFSFLEEPRCYLELFFLICISKKISEQFHFSSLSLRFLAHFFNTQHGLYGKRRRLKLKEETVHFSARFF